jgi:hypothetical protein
MPNAMAVLNVVSAREDYGQAKKVIPLMSEMDTGTLTPSVVP